MSGEARDWVAWHRAYDEPASRLSRRLRVVQEHLRRAIDAKPGPLRIVSMCAGEGRDVIGVLAQHPRRGEIDATLVERDALNAGVAREASVRLSLDSVRVVEADAALTDSYAGAVPADIILACGIFGNISDDDVRRTVEHLPSLCAPDAVVLWTRGQERHRDFALTIREWFVESGFGELAYESPVGETFRVGVNRLVSPTRPLELGVRLFTFFR